MRARMVSDGGDPKLTRAKLEAELSKARAAFKKVRDERQELRAQGRGGEGELLDDEVARLRRAVDLAEEALRGVAKATAEEAGLRLDGERVRGMVAVLVPPGTSSADRRRLLDRALGAPLEELAQAHGLALQAAPSRYLRERPGRDAEGRTVLDVAGHVEGDLIVPG